MILLLTHSAHHLPPRYWTCPAKMLRQGLRFPCYVPDENLSQTTCTFPVNELLRVGQLNVHVAVDADQSTLVLGLAPFQANENGVGDTMLKRLGRP